MTRALNSILLFYFVSRVDNEGEKMAEEVTGPSPRGGPEDLKPSEKRFVDEKLAAHNEEDRLVMRLTFLKGRKRKREERLLVIGTYRVYVFKGTKCTDELHLLDLEEINIPAENEICFKFKADISLSFVTRNIEELIQKTTRSFNKCFPTVPEEYQFKVLRDKDPVKIKRSSTMNIGSCGGFVKTYKAVCDYLGLPVRQDLCWDVENILLFGNIHEFNMMDYFYGKDTIALSELKPLTTSLEHNVWFTSFVSGHKIGAEGVQCVAPLVQFNSRMEALVLKQTGCNKPQVWEAFGESLIKNKYLAISTLDLSGNPIEDAGMVKIASAIQQWRCPLRYLDVSNTGLSKHGIGNILASIAGNQNVYTTLEYLNVGDNKGIVDVDVTKALTDLMNKTKNLKTLILKNTQLTGWGDIKLCSSLTSLDISGNKINEGEGYSVAAAIAPSSSNLKLLNMSNTLASATIINQVAATCTAVQSLNLADNELGDDGLIAVCECLKQNKNLKELSLDRNWVHKSKNRQRAIESLISLVTAQANNTPSIKILLMTGSVKNRSQLKEELRPFILALMGDTSLETLDVSGQGMGDVGALALSKTLQTDPNLRRVVVDENGTTIVGFKVLVNSLERNFHLSSLPIPIADIMKIIANNSEKQRDVSQLLEQLEYKLRTNEQRLSEEEMNEEVETEPSSLDDSDGSMTARARKTRSQSYFPRLKPMSGPNSNSSTSGEYASLRPDPRREQRRRPSEKQLNKGSLNPRMLAQQSAQNTSPNGREREVNTMRERENRSNTLGGDTDRPAVPTLKLDGASTLPVGPMSDRNLLRQPSNEDLTNYKVVQTARESTKDKKEVKIDRETLRKEKEKKKKEEENKLEKIVAPVQLPPPPQDTESPRLSAIKDNESEKSDKSNKSDKKAQSDKDSDKGNTTPREEKPLAKSEPTAIASPSIEQPKSKARHTHNKSELPSRPKPAAGASKRRREFDTATALTLFGDMEKVLEAPPSENAEVNDLKALLIDADIKLNL